MPSPFAARDAVATPIWFVTRDTWDAARAALPGPARAFAEASGFKPKPGSFALLPDAQGALAGALFAVEGAPSRLHDPLAAGALATKLPAGVYRFGNTPPGGARASEFAALGFALSSYRFTRYRGETSESPRLVAPEGVGSARLARVAESLSMARDLVNTPANDMGPDALEAAALSLARDYGAQAHVIAGDALLQANFPLIHAVGRAAKEPPRLVDITWGQAAARKVTLVGKGVCFDTGGLDIKPSSAMLLMKKDMAGAAAALALARMIMDARLAVRLRVLLPIVENVIAGDAFRPGDIYPSRKGLSVEIGNTDAEGRLILADALALADEEAPEFLFDFATLTGAARVALGPELAPFYTMDDTLAEAITRHGTDAADPVWRMPLWDNYDKLLDSKSADLCNVSSGPFAGSITAALFLRRFVEKTPSWTHFDIYGWNPSARPGRPEGGEAQTVRLLYDLIEARVKA